MMTEQLVRAAVLAACAVVMAATAAADPTPGYQIEGPSGPQFPGAQVYPPRCLEAMLACGFKYDPGTGTWDAPPGTS